MTGAHPHVFWSYNHTQQQVNWHHSPNQSPPSPRHSLSIPLHLPIDLSLETVTPAVRIKLMTAYYDSNDSVAKVLYSSKIHKDTTSCRQWYSFFWWLQIPLYLHGIKYPVPFLEIFSKGMCRYPCSQGKSIKKTWRKPPTLLESIRGRGC